MKTKLVSIDEADFAAELQAALLNGGYRVEWNEPAERADDDLDEAPALFIVDGRAYAQVPRGEEIPRPAEVPEGAPLVVWAPQRIEARAPWAGGAFVNGIRALLLALRDEDYLAQFRK